MFAFGMGRGGGETLLKHIYQRITQEVDLLILLKKYLAKNLLFPALRLQKDLETQDVNPKK